MEECVTCRYRTRSFRDYSSLLKIDEEPANRWSIMYMDDRVVYQPKMVLDGIRIWTRSIQNSYVKKISDDNVRSSQNCKEPRDVD